jgi:hypothetical protein
VVWGYVLSVLGLGMAALQTNMADNAMRDHGASTLENMLWVNGLGVVIVVVVAAGVDGMEALVYMRDTPHAAQLLALRSFTFYFGAFFFTELTRHSGRLRYSPVRVSKLTGRISPLTSDQQCTRTHSPILLPNIHNIHAFQIITRGGG